MLPRDRYTFKQLLRHLHRLLGAPSQPCRDSLLQCAGGEGRIRVAPFFFVSTFPTCQAALCRSSMTALTAGCLSMPGSFPINLHQARFESGLRSRGSTSKVQYSSGDKRFDLAVFFYDQSQSDRLYAPRRERRRFLAPHPGPFDLLPKQRALENENRELLRRVGKHQIVWTSDAMTRIMAQLDRVAASETRICIYGETQKELAARTLHEKSSRAHGPFITLNCAAVPPELIESELFGHEKGAFTRSHAAPYRQV